jgi:hypothetical protein
MRCGATCRREFSCPFGDTHVEFLVCEAQDVEIWDVLCGTELPRAASVVKVPE